MIEAWHQCLTRLEQDLPAQIFSTWVKPLTFLSWTESELTLRLVAPNRTKLDWVKNQFASRIETLVIEFFHPDAKVLFELGAPTARSQAEIQANLPDSLATNSQASTPFVTTGLNNNAESNQNSVDNTNSNTASSFDETEQTSPTSSKLTNAYSKDFSGGGQNQSVNNSRRHIERAKLNPDLTFDSFVTGKANQMARAAAEQVAQRPGTSYNPLFFYGGVGLGKTHLIHAVGAFLLEKNPNAKVRYIHAEQYVSDVVKAYQRKAFDEFKNYYHSLDLLLIDDIQFFSGKSRTQEEFFYAFEALANARKQLIITSDTYPKDMAGFEERLLSRFGSGLTVAIEPPELEMRVAILLKKAEQIQLGMPSDVAFFIAKQLRSNVRELEGALKKVAAFSTFHNQAITLDLVKEALKEILSVSRVAVSIEAIQKTVADYYKIKVADMYSKRRPAAIALPRQIAMFLAKELTQKSLPEIGELFGGRDHTTVLHAVRKITDLRTRDTQINHDLHVLEQALRG
jgi:chromosomal replication initiator protein